MSVGALVGKLYSKGYGFPELREWIKKNTLRGFLYTLVIFILLVLLYFGIQKLIEVTTPKTVQVVTRINVQNLPPPPTQAQEEQAPPPEEVKQVVYRGPAARAGTPIPVPDALVSPELKEFATIEDVSVATPVGGEGEGGEPVIPENAIIAEPPQEEPGMYEFIPVEKEPYIDLAELKKKIKYPEIARRAGLEGRVVVRVLVGKDGKPVKAVIEQSDNEVFNQAAIEAIMSSIFTPAIQNGEPVAVWVSIPIDFKLK